MRGKWVPEQELAISVDGGQKESMALRCSGARKVGGH